MHAVLEEHRIFDHASSVFGVIVEPAECAMNGVGGCCSRGVHSGQHVEGHLSTNHISRQIQGVLIADQHREHIFGQFVLFDLPRAEPLEELGAAVQRRSEELLVPALQRLGHLGSQLLGVSRAVNRSGAFAELDCIGEQPIGLFCRAL